MTPASRGPARRHSGTAPKTATHQHQSWDTLLAQAAPVAAPQLLGWIIQAPGVSARITEVEAYHGQADRACHAARGRTRRTDVLYHAPGTLYVYRCYGVHWMLNLVCDRIAMPSAVLVRSIEILSGDQLVRERRGLTAASQRNADVRRLTNGPGKVCQALALDGSVHGRHLSDPQLSVSLTPPERPVTAWCCGPRIGVGYAGRFWAPRRWRWWIRGFPVVSHAG